MKAANRRCYLVMNLLLAAVLFGATVVSARNATLSELRDMVDCIKRVTTEVWLVYEDKHLIVMPTVSTKLDRNTTTAILRCSIINGNNKVGLMVEDSNPTEENGNKRMIGNVDDEWLNTLNVEDYTRPSNAVAGREKRSEDRYHSYIDSEDSTCTNVDYIPLYTIICYSYKSLYYSVFYENDSTVAYLEVDIYPHYDCGVAQIKKDEPTNERTLLIAPGYICEC